MQNIVDIAGLAGIALIGLLTIGFVFARLYKRSTKELAFVRTGLGGQKAVSYTHLTLPTKRIV